MLYFHRCDPEVKRHNWTVDTTSRWGGHAVSSTKFTNWIEFGLCSVEQITLLTSLRLHSKSAHLRELCHCASAHQPYTVNIFNKHALLSLRYTESFICTFSFRTGFIKSVVQSFLLFELIQSNFLKILCTCSCNYVRSTRSTLICFPVIWDRPP